MRFSLVLLLCASAAWGQTCAPPGNLRPAGVVNGTLNEASCRLSDGTLYAEYLLSISAHGVLKLQTNSTGSSASAIVRDAAGHAVATGKNIQQPFEAGLYRVLVTAGAPGQTGDFTLQTAYTGEPDILCQTLTRIGAGRSVTGQLNSGSCALPDHSRYEGFAITAFGAGTLDIAMDSAEFSPYLILRAEDGSEFASDPGNGSSSHISVAVDGNETYSIIASAADANQKPGQYHLAVNFTPADDETCRPSKVLTDTDQVPGSIAVGSCAFNLPGRDDSALFNFYDIRVSTGGFAEIQLKDATFGPLLLLLDADGNFVAQDSQSGGPGVPLIRQQLAPGAYRLLVYNQDSFQGDYTLQYNFRPGLPDICPVLSLDAARTVTGTLDGTTGCRTNGLVADVYRITLPSSGTLDLNFSSSDFTTSLNLRDASDNLLTGGEQTPDGTSSRVLTDLPAGTYTVVAASLDVSGGYNLGYQFTAKDLAPCPAPQALPVNSGYIGLLGAGMAGSASCAGRDGRPVDSYQFTTASAGTIAAVMTSKEIASLVTLSDATGATLRWDDHSYANDNALIAQYLPAGTYRLAARSAGTRTTGLYRLDLLFSAGDRPGFCGARPISAGSSVAGSLNFTSCQYSDHTFADIYQFSVSGSTAAVEIDAASDKFNAYLILLDSKGSLIASDDDSGGGTNARIAQNLDPGVYYFVVKPADDPSTSGDYTVGLSLNPPLNSN